MEEYPSAANTELVQLFFELVEAASPREREMLLERLRPFQRQMITRQPRPGTGQHR